MYEDIVWILYLESLLELSTKLKILVKYFLYKVGSEKIGPMTNIKQAIVLLIRRKLSEDCLSSNKICLRLEVNSTKFIVKPGVLVK